MIVLIVFHQFLHPKFPTEKSLPRLWSPAMGYLYRRTWIMGRTEGNRCHQKCWCRFHYIIAGNCDLICQHEGISAGTKTASVTWWLPAVCRPTKWALVLVGVGRTALNNMPCRPIVYSRNTTVGLHLTLHRAKLANRLLTVTLTLVR